MDKIIHTNDGLHPYFRESRPVKRKNYVKYIVAMKIFLLLLALSFHLSAKVFSQQISLNAKEESLRSVLKSIKKQSGYGFLLGSTSLKEAKPVTISLHLNSVEDALKKIFENQNLSYSIEGNFITVRPKPVAEKNLGPAMVSSLEGKRILIKGKVTDQKKKPLEGVSIRVKESNKGTITDAYGNYSIAADPTDILVFTYIGFYSVELKVENKTEINISLTESSTDLKEFGVVSTGYQTIPQERATGSFALPDKKMFEARVSTDVLSKLDGITSGVVFNPPGLTGSNEAQISIRGRSTIFANTQPLVVVDNFPYDGNITDINPNDVESITILKDAAAASIWGVRAGNGVIVVTTKRGKMNQPLRISFNSNLTISQKPNLFYDPNVISSNDEIKIEQMLFANGFYDSKISDLSSPALTPVVEILNDQKNGKITAAQAGAKINALRNVDIRNQLNGTFYRPQFNQQYALNVSGGNEKSSTYLSAGYDHNNAMLKGSDYERVTLNFANDYRVIKNLTLSTGINYVQTTTNSDNTLGSFLSGTKYPYLLIQDQSGNPLPIEYGHSASFVNSAINNGFLDWSFNPLKELKNGFNTNKVSTSSTRITAGLQYTIIKGLSAEIKAQYERSNTNGSNYSSVESYEARNLINQFTDLTVSPIVYNIPMGGIMRANTSTLLSRNIRGQFNYNNQLGVNSYLSAILGIEARESKVDFNNYNYYGYDPNNANQTPVSYTTIYNLNPNGTGTIPNNSNTGGTLDRFRSYFGNAAYTYRNKYTVTASARVDGSNYFGVETNQKNVPLWSIGTKWDLDKEPFYNITWLPTLKIRATYGYNGNLDKTLTAVTTLKYTGVPSSYTNVVNARIDNIGNPDLRWEKAGLVNLGLDFGLYNQIVSGSIEYFHKNGKDLIGDIPVAPNTGFSTFRGNFANMTGQGVDVRLMTNNNIGKLSWATTFLFSWATDKVTRYDGNRTPGDLLTSNQNTFPLVGKPVYTIYSLKWAGLDPQTGDPQGYDLNGKISKDYGSLNQPGTFDQLVYNGPARPIYSGGLNNRISFKNLALNFNISYKFGYFFRRNSINYTRLYNSQQGHIDFSDRWQKPGDEKKTNVPSMISPVDQARDLFYSYSSVLIDKGDHIRLQDISLSYDINKLNFKKLPFQRIQFYLYANNLGILWRANKDGIDPDYPLGGIPAIRSYSLGIKAEF